jgi:hypothetical protein
MKDFKHGEVVRYAVGWKTFLFRIENIVPSTCPEGHRYYGQDINGKAVAAQQNEIFAPSEKELLKWNSEHK